MSLRPTRIALIHALAESVAPIQAAFAEDWPQASLMNLLDDSLSADLARNAGGLDARFHQRFIELGAYAISTGAQAILFTCSAFGPCIDAVKARWPAMPILKPNEAMIAQVEASGLRTIGLLASFAPTLASMPAEFSRHVALKPELCEGALAALKAGMPQEHDAIIVNHAQRLAAQGVDGLAIAQFSMARSAEAVRQATGLPVFTTPQSAVQLLALRLEGSAEMS
jgi:aspartate/glutamate racemase